MKNTIIAKFNKNGNIKLGRRMWSFSNFTATRHTKAAALVPLLVLVAIIVTVAPLPVM